MLEIGADENFGDVPFPELVRLAIARRTGREVKRSRRDGRKQMQKFSCQRSESRCDAQAQIAFRAVIGEHAGDAVPKFRSGISAGRSIGFAC